MDRLSDYLIEKETIVMKRVHEDFSGSNKNRRKTLIERRYKRNCKSGRSESDARRDSTSGRKKLVWKAAKNQNKVRRTSSKHRIYRKEQDLTVEELNFMADSIIENLIQIRMTNGLKLKHKNINVIVSEITNQFT